MKRKLRITWSQELRDYYTSEDDFDLDYIEAMTSLRQSFEAGSFNPSNISYMGDFA